TGTVDKPERVAYEPPGYVRIRRKKFGQPWRPVEKGTEFGRVQPEWVATPPEGIEVKVRLKGAAQILFSPPSGQPIAGTGDLHDIRNAAVAAVVCLARYDTTA